MLVFVSANRDACQLFRTSQTALIPSEIFKKLGALGRNFFVGVYETNNNNGRSLAQFILDGKADSVILLTDIHCRHLTQSYSDACFSVPIDLGGDAKQYKNRVRSVLNTTLKHQTAFSLLMSDAGSMQPLILPLRNFEAKEIPELRRLFSQEMLEKDFTQRVTKIVAQLNKRKGPRRETDSKEKHFFDDKKKLFSYGYERHAQVETKPPHDALCRLNGYFRFGSKLDERRHFNVTKEDGEFTKISGNFPNCHGAIAWVGETTHINMFANDFH